MHVKGAPERVLRMCAGIDTDLWHGQAEALAQRGCACWRWRELPETGHPSGVAAMLEGG